MNLKVSPRSRKLKPKDDSKYETIVQVHKILKSEKDDGNLTKRSTDNSEDGESNKAFQMEDYNENFNDSHIHTHNKEISVDGLTQIDSKILSLIETEMTQDINKHSHFTDSRPQSLSFYEDEKVLEELSGNLELLSPEERKHYRRRRDYSHLDSDERKAYSAIQELYSSKESDEANSKKSKSKKKRHVDNDVRMGDSTEVMIPKEKKKNRKKKKDFSTPMINMNKKKSRHRDEEHEIRNDITIALEELHDDVFENSFEGYNKGKKKREISESVDRLYVQKKNKFEVSNRPTFNRDMYEDPNSEKLPTKDYKAPLNVAICIQKYCSKMFLQCHGLLAGLSFGQWMYLICNHFQDDSFLKFYSNFSDVFITFFYLLITICLLSSLDRIDIAHMNRQHFMEFCMFYRVVGLLIILLYTIGLVLHLSLCNIENKLGLLSIGNHTLREVNISSSEIQNFNHISQWRFVFVLLPWILIAVTPSEQDNMLYVHLQSMVKYLPEKYLYH